MFALFYVMREIIVIVMLLEMKEKDVGLISADEVQKLLGRKRSSIDRYILKGTLKPEPTIYPKYFFKKSHVIELKNSLT